MADAGLALPSDRALIQELGWALHGNVSHLAIRRHIYHDRTSVAVEQVIAIHVTAFLAGVKAVLQPRASAQPASPRAKARRSS